MEALISGRSWRFLHPFFIALLPPISLLAHNVHEMRLGLATRSVLVSLALSLVLVIIGRLLTNDWGRATLLSSLILLVLGSYGHLYGMLKQYDLAGITIGRHRYLLPLALACLAAGGFLIARARPPSHSLLSALTISAIAATMIPLFQLTTFLLQHPQQFSQRATAATSIEPVAQGRENLPDIYYIILDSYARQDTLELWFGYDNREFVSGLEVRGFYVADQSNSNYFGTAVSLASTLNMDYLQELEIDLDRGIYPSNLRESITHSAVRAELEELGYKTVAFPTDYYPTEFEDADYFLQPGVTPLERLHLTGRLNNFEALLARGTIAQAFLDLQLLRESSVGDFVQEHLDEPRRHRREIVLSTLLLLETVPEFDEPTFTFAHLQIPHSPYIFDRNGDLVSTEALESRTGSHIADSNEFYLDQLIYTSKLITETIDAILANSELAPIIILQSDHGPEPDMDWTDPDPESLRARMGILNAYLVPEDCQQQLYSSISPVNSYRMLFNCLGFIERPLLIDRSYYSNLRSRSDKLEFVPVEELLLE